MVDHAKIGLTRSLIVSLSCKIWLLFLILRARMQQADIFFLGGGTLGPPLGMGVADTLHPTFVITPNLVALGQTV